MGCRTRADGGPPSAERFVVSRPSLSPQGAHGPHVGIYAVESTVTRVRRRSRGVSVGFAAPASEFVDTERDPGGGGDGGEQDRQRCEDPLERRLTGVVWREREETAGEAVRVYGKIKSYLIRGGSQRRLRGSREACPFRSTSSSWRSRDAHTMSRGVASAAHGAWSVCS